METATMVMALRLSLCTTTSNPYAPPPVAPAHVGGFVGVGRPQGILKNAGAPAAGTNCQYNSDGEYVSGTDCTVDITGNDYAFAALKSDGSVKVWGRATYGGTDPGLTSTDNVVSIVSTSQAL